MGVSKTNGSLFGWFGAGNRNQGTGGKPKNKAGPHQSPGCATGFHLQEDLGDLQYIAEVSHAPSD